ncbi:hypothetical protein CPB86DRAFT_802663 [Serendipita vermifera]|nr:hypothetical protein CPB86DRAFT_802663 [Serendipita vermifera]
MDTQRSRETIYVHDSTHCECCLDFWGLTPSTTATLTTPTEGGAAGANSTITGSGEYYSRYYHSNQNAEEPERGTRTTFNSTTTTTTDASTGDHVDQKKRRRRATRAPVELDGNSVAKSSAMQRPKLIKKRNESEAEYDSGYGSATLQDSSSGTSSGSASSLDESGWLKAKNRFSLGDSSSCSSLTFSIPRIVITPLTDDEQRAHNAALRAQLWLPEYDYSPYSVLQPNTYTVSSVTDTTDPRRQSTLSTPNTPLHLLRTPDLAYTCRIKDTWDNRERWPAFFVPPYTTIPIPNPRAPPQPEIIPILSSRDSCSSLASKLSKRRSLEIDLHPSKVQTPTRVDFSCLGGGLGMGLKRKNGIRKSSSSRSLASSISSVGSVGSLRSTTSLPVQNTPRARLIKPNNNSNNASTNDASGDASSATVLASKVRKRWSLAMGEDIQITPGVAPGILTNSTNVADGASSTNANTGGNMFGRGMRKLAGLYSTAPSSFRL